MSRYISKLPEPIRELAEKRRSEQMFPKGIDILPRAFDWFITNEGVEFWSEINKENYSVFYEKNAQDNCTCNSRTVDESGNVVHFEECEKEKDKLDEVIYEIGKAITMWKNTDLEMDGLHTLETILNKAKEIKGKQYDKQISRRNSRKRKK